jgi:hypothetical protein
MKNMHVIAAWCINVFVLLFEVVAIVTMTNIKGDNLNFALMLFFGFNAMLVILYSIYFAIVLQDK